MGNIQKKNIALMQRTVDEIVYPLGLDVEKFQIFVQQRPLSSQLTLLCINRGTGPFGKIKRPFFADLMEYTLYNAFLSGVSLDGQRYFYVNPLASDREATLRDGTRGRQPSSRRARDASATNIAGSPGRRLAPE